MKVVEFIDRYILLTEEGKAFKLSTHQRVVFGLAFSRHYQIRLWSEPKKSGKTFLASCILLYECITHADCEVISAANDAEQSQSRVFATAVALCQKNRELMASVVKITASEIKFSNGSALKAIASEYKGAAGGRQRVTCFDELWAYSSENMVRLFEEMVPPVSEPESYILMDSCHLMSNT